MLKRIKSLSKKEKGNFGCMIIAILAALAIATITTYKVEERQIHYIKKSMTNATILSLMSSNVIDLNEYASRDAILYDACDKVGDIYVSQYGNCSSSEFNNGMKIAYIRAKEKFERSFKINADVQNDAGDCLSFINNKDLSKKYYKEIKIKKLVMYNVFQGNVYKYEGIGDTILLGSVDNDYRTETDNIITNSGLYVEIYVKLSFLGRDFDMPIKQFVDITAF